MATTLLTKQFEKNGEWRIVRLPSALCAQVEQRFASNFSGLEDLLVAVLQELACDAALKMDAAERQMLEQRLRQLGYL